MLWNNPSVVDVAERRIAALKNPSLPILGQDDLLEDIASGPFNHFYSDDARARVSSTLACLWMRLMAATAARVPGSLLVRHFPKSCGGCMVFTVFSLVGAFPDSTRIQIAAFDFFCAVLGDLSGMLVTQEEVRVTASYLQRSVVPRGFLCRNVCLELHIQEHKQLPLINLVEGLGVLATSDVFVAEMRADCMATNKRIAELMKQGHFTEEYLRTIWSSGTKNKN